MKLLVPLHEYLITSKLYTFPYLLQMKLFVFPKMKCFETKKLFYGGDEHLWVQLVDNLIKINENNKKDTHKNH